MSTAAPSLHRQPHPAPQRRRVGRWGTWFGLLGAPLAWGLQLLVNAAIGAHGCYPSDMPLATSIWPHARAVMAAVELGALALVLAAAWGAWRSWQRTREERPGSAHQLIGGGDGRTRFMAMAALMTSALFLLAVLFSALNLAATPACGG